MSTKIVPEKKPKMLKDFLRDFSNSCTNSCSSTGFKSYPRSLPDHPDPTTTIIPPTLPRSRSRSRATAQAAISSFQKLLNAVKSLHYSPTPSTLPRTISRKFLGMVKKRGKSSEVMNSKIVVIKVKVKDILRWKSFRDLVGESQPLDFVGPNDHVDAPVGSSSTSTSSSECESSECESSEGSGVSWIDSDDFTVTEEDELLPCCLGDFDDEVVVEGKKWDNVIVASDSDVGSFNEDNDKIASEGDKEHQSPISVLNSPFRDEVSDEELPSSFDQSLANMERTKQRLLQSIHWFESLAGVQGDDETDSTEEDEEQQEDGKPREDDNAIEATSRFHFRRELRWFKRGRESLIEKNECIKAMEKQGQWSKFDEEREELGVELEVVVLSDLLDEVFSDLCI